MNTGSKALLTAFIQSEKTRGKRPSWLRALPYRIGKLFAYLEAQGLELTQLDAEAAQGFPGWLLHQARYTGRTVACYLTAAGSFCAYLKRMNVLPANPFTEIRRPRTERTLPRNIPKEQTLAAILDRLNTWEQEKNLRDRLKVYRAHLTAELQYSTGLRISEAAGLNVTDIDFDTGTVHVRNGKGGIERVCFLNEYTSRILKLYTQYIRPHTRTVWHSQTDSLFYSKTDWFCRTVNEEVAKAAKAEGCFGFSCHSFRHALGFHLLRSGAPIRYIQQILGHRKLRNTEVYTKVDKEDLKSVLDAKHPRQWRPS